jgi:hypothetical protein
MACKSENVEALGVSTHQAFAIAREETEARGNQEETPTF